MSARNSHIGKQATDLITGFEGLVCGYAQYITGCDQYLLSPKCAEGDNTVVEGTWFDANRLEFQKTKKVVLETTEAKGAMTPPARNY